MGLKLSPTKWQLLINTLSQVLTKVFTSVTTLVVSLVIITRFGLLSYGDFIKVTTFVAFFYLLSDFGLNAAAIRLGAGSVTSPVWSSLLRGRFWLSIFWFLVAIVILVFLPTGANQGYSGLVKLGIIVFAPTIIFQGFLTSANAAYQQFLRYDYSTLAVGVGSVVTILLVVLGAFVFVPTAGLIWGLLAGLVGSILMSLLAVFFARRLTQKNFSFWGSPVGFSDLLKKSWPFALTLFFNLVYFRFDSVVITLTRSTTEVGIYGLVYKIFEIPLVLPLFFMNSTYPLLVRFAQGDRVKLATTLKRLGFGLLVVGVLSGLFLFLAAPFVVWVRPEFAVGVGALRVLAIGLPVFFLSSLTMWLLVVLNKQISLLVIYAAGMTLNVGLNIWLVPQFGFLAAAWVTVFSEVFVLGLSVWRCFGVFSLRQKGGEYGV